MDRTERIRSDPSFGSASFGGRNRDTCDACEQPWAALFEWSYTSAERYCHDHLLEPIEGQPGKVFVDFMPDCQRISHRIDPVRRPAHVVRHSSTRMLQLVLTGYLAPR